MAALVTRQDDWTPARLAEDRARRKRFFQQPAKKLVPAKKPEIPNLSASFEVKPKVVNSLSCAITVSFTRPLLPVKEYEKYATKKIQLAVCRHASLTFGELVGPFRNISHTRARFIAIVLIHILRPELSLPAIGRRFNRDHTSILHALRKMADVEELIRMRVPENAPVEDFVKAGFEAWDEVIRPQKEKNAELHRLRVIASIAKRRAAQKQSTSKSEPAGETTCLK